jgi:Protein kinase domain/TIR domain
MIRQASGIAGGTQPQVFVSYARQDAEQVLTITGLLEGEGATVWRDEDRILGGQYYGEQIVHAIAHSRVVVLMCSPQAFQSDNVHREVLLTWDHYHRSYIPVWLSPATVIPDRFRFCLAGCQWIDAHSQPPERWLPQLLQALRALDVETTKPGGPPPGDATPRPAGVGVEPVRAKLRFKPGDRPIPGADWVVERLLGKGGFGEVWKAHHPRLSSMPPVALKFCMDLDDRSRDLLHHEADIVLQAQRQIHSDGIVPLLHAYLDNDPPCLEYPYIEGGTLVRLHDECREKAGSFSPLQAQRIIQRIAQIVGPAHRATPKLVHRDLKPSNILVERGKDGKIVLRVTDFGIGGIAAQPMLERSRSSSSLMGNMASVLTGLYSPLYASPQQVRGDKPDPRDDVYALGVIWYQLVAGDLTVPAPTGRRWVDDLRKRGMRDAAVDLLASCFENAPGHRPNDAGALFELLQALAPPASTKQGGSTADLHVVGGEPAPNSTQAALREGEPLSRDIKFRAK